MKKGRGHYCRICDCNLPNESFSGKGHKQHICKKCSSRPKEEIDRIDQRDEIYIYMEQSHISQKNLDRLALLKNSTDHEIAELAAIVYEVGLVKPYKTRRLKFLTRNHRDLLQKLEEAGLIQAHYW